MKRKRSISIAFETKFDSKTVKQAIIGVCKIVALLASFSSILVLVFINTMEIKLQFGCCVKKVGSAKGVNKTKTHTKRRPELNARFLLFLKSDIELFQTL